MSRDGRYHLPGGRGVGSRRPRARPGFTPRTPWTRSPAGCAPFTGLSPASSRRPAPSGAGAAPGHRALIIAHNDAATYNAAWHGASSPGSSTRTSPGPPRRHGTWPSPPSAGCPCTPARCRRRGVHRLHGQAPPASTVPEHVWLVSDYRTVPRCGPGARHGPRRRHPRPRRLGRPGVGDSSARASPTPSTRPSPNSPASRDSALSEPVPPGRVRKPDNCHSAHSMTPRVPSGPPIRSVSMQGLRTYLTVRSQDPAEDSGAAANV